MEDAIIAAAGIAVITTGFTLVACGFAIHSAVRARRLNRKLDEELKRQIRTQEELDERLTHAILLDNMLNELCLSAFSNAHVPIWAAWAASMGHYEVKISTHAHRDVPEDLKE